MGRPQKPSTRRKIAKAMTGSKNPAFKDGRRSYRRIAGAKPGQQVHHRDGDRKNNQPSNLKKINPSQRGKHDAAHNRAANFKKSGGTKKGAHTKKSKPKRMR